MEEAESRRPADTNFKQQRLRACQPLLTPRVVVLTYLALAIIMLPLGFAMWAANNSVRQVMHRYDNEPSCMSGSEYCRVLISIPEDMEGPLYVYYRLSNFYQNHRRYVKSRNYDQLQGMPPTTLDALSDCAPLDVLNGTTDAERADNSTWLLPCGLIASSQFSDRFRFVKNDVNLTLVRTDISWPSDREVLFKQPPASPMYARLARVPQQEFPGQTTNFTDEDFIVWMRVAGLPTFRKLYGRFQSGLTAGMLEMHVLNNFDVSSFNGEKWIVITNLSWVGGKNDFLGYAFIVVGALCLLLSIVFFLVNIIHPRKLGDASLLSWNQGEGPASTAINDM